MADPGAATVALYLFGVMRASDSCRLLDDGRAGGEGRPFALSVGAVAAIVEAVPVAEFRSEALERHLSDPAWVSARARRHHEVVEAIARVAPAIPAKLATVFLGEERLRGLLEAHGHELGSFLERVDGREEWGVRVGADSAMLEARADRCVPALAVLAEQVARAEPGAAWLLRKRQSQLRAAESRRLAGELAGEVALEIEGLVEAATEAALRDLPDSPVAQPILELAVLVKRAERDRFERALAAMAEAHADAGLLVALSGPWPPYSFCPRLEADGPGERAPP